MYPLSQILLLQILTRQTRLSDTPWTEALQLSYLRRCVRSEEASESSCEHEASGYYSSASYDTDLVKHKEISCSSVCSTDSATVDPKILPLLGLAKNVCIGKTAILGK